MKKLTTLFLTCFLIFGYAKAQYVSIPDANFRAFLKGTFPAAFNVGGQMDTTNTQIVLTDSLITYYNISGGSRIDTIHFQGLQYFKNLKFLYIEPMLLVSTVVIDNNVLPNSIKTLQFGGLNSVIFNTSKLPDSLINFTNVGCSVFSGTNVTFPPVFKNFTFSGTRSYNPWINGNSFPATMETFKVSALMSYSPLAKLPVGLTTFELESCWGVHDFSYMTLPAGLKQLWFIDANRNIDTNTILLPHLPASLISLSLNGTKTLCLPTLPDSLQTLDITGASVPCISKLPNAYLQVTPNTPICNATNNTNACSVITANYVNIPDSNFAKYLITQTPNCLYKDSNNLYWMDTTCSGVIKLDSINIDGTKLSYAQKINNITGVEYFKGLKYLMTAMNSINSIQTLPGSLEHIELIGNQISTLPSLPASLTYLECSMNNLISLPTLPVSLKSLIIPYNPIASLPALPKSLDLLGVWSTNIHCLPTLPDSLTALSIDSNISCLPNRPAGLIVYSESSPIVLNRPFCNATNNPNSCTVYGVANYVNIPDSNFAKYLITQMPSCLYKDSNNLYWMDTTCSGVVNMDSIACYSTIYMNLYIQDLNGIQYFKNLKYLNCNNNQLTSLPTLPNSLIYLNCSGNQLISLPILPNSLTDLYCDFNKISALPTIPNSLTGLSCNKNQLISLPPLPNKFAYLHCESNQLTVLPSLPDSLRTLDCKYNQLTVLPVLNESLIDLYCDYNQLSFLPTLPDSLNILSCCGNNNLYCLPKLPSKLLRLEIDSSSIHCIPNPVSGLFIYNNSYGYINVPVCNPTNNASQCLPFPIVHGKVFTDDNSNGLKDGNEYYRPFVQLNASNGTSVVTNTNGEYTLALTDTGTYTLTTVVPTGFKAVPASNTFSFNNNVASLSLPDIALQPINTNDSLTVFIMPLLWAKPGQEIQYFVSYENVGSVLANDTVKIVYDTAHLIFDSCSMPVISHNGNTIITSNNVLTPGDYNYFFAYFTVKPTAVLGDSVFATASIASTNTSASYLSYENVVSSYDPNYKDATPELSPVQVVNGTFIDYNIHFQNTGNDTAFNIVLADTLSPLLKSNILQVVATSHPCNITLKDSIIYFEFLKINLPDSNRNNFRSNGFVHFRLLPQNNVPAGGRINNKASIYFDYNNPVVTNTASTLIKPYGVPVVIRNYNVVAERVGENKLLEVINTWTVSTEINTAYYTIQRSITGRDFENVGKVIAKDARDYSFTDIPTTDATVIYYRLKITDKDGKVAYSDIKQIFIQPQTMFVSIYPNPAKNYFTVKGYNVSQINVVDNTGRIVMSRKGLNTNAVENKVNINVADGIYILQAIHTDGTIVNEKLIIKQ
ncbi:MAG: T9SS type A sorting domain-containing protein [Bacteroidota bacterium]